MNPRDRAGIALILCVGLAATTAGSTPAPSGQLYSFGSRSLPQRLSPTGIKLDAALAELTRHLGRLRPGHEIEDLHSLSPAARFARAAADTEPLILIDAVTRGDPQRLRESLESLGLQRAAVFSNDVSGWLPVQRIEEAAALDTVHSVRAAMPRARAGAVTTQGDYVQRSDVLRTTYPTLTGSGVTVAAISDSFNCYPVYAQNGVPASGYAGYASNGFTATATQDVNTGDLPAGVKVVREATCMNYGAPTQLPFGDEGRAMLQVIHDVAPGAALAFYTAEDGEASFATGIGALAAAGVRVIADDVGYFDEPFFQDGLVAQAVDAAEAKGVVYFSAAGNDGSNGYDNLAPAFATHSTSGPTSGEYLLNFDTSGATNTTALSVAVPAMNPGDLIAVVLQWDQPYVTGAPHSPGATSHLDLCATGASGLDQIIANDSPCTGPNGTGKDPVQILIISNPANSAGPSAAQTVNLLIGLADGTPPPGRIKLSVEDNGLGVTLDPALVTHGGTVQGHPGAAGAAAVGAAFFFRTPRCGTTPATAERYSAQGGTPILFDSSGTLLSTPTLRQKPDFVAPDGGNDTFLGFTLASGGVAGGLLNTSDPSCQNNPRYPNFFGTSAATPHAAAIAALMLQANASLTPSQVRSALQATALPMGMTTPDDVTGYGFIQADAALASLPPGPPVLTLGSASVTEGSTTTLKWTAINTTTCSASGSWSGTQAASGSLTITAPMTAGTNSYTLTCSNPHGSAQATAKLTVTAAAMSNGGGGGGGDLGGLCLLGLASLALRRALRSISAA